MSARHAPRHSGTLRSRCSGAGSWGTALAVQFARGGRARAPVGPRCAHNFTHGTACALQRALPARGALSGFPRSAAPSSPQHCAGARDVLVVVPSPALRALLQQLAPHLAPGMQVAWATKGFEAESGKLPHQVAREVLGAERPVAVLSGPTFAREVGAGLPTAMTIASPDAEYAPGPRAGPLLRELPRLHLPRHHRGRDRRRGEECARRRRRTVRRARLRCQHARRAHHARAWRR